MKDECGFTGGVPYWDEQRDFDELVNIENASVWGSENLSFGSNGENGAGCVVVSSKKPITIWASSSDRLELYNTRSFETC